MFERNLIPTTEKPKEKFPNVDAEVAKNLESIDFDILNDVFLRKIKSLGVDRDSAIRNLQRFVSNPNSFKRHEGYGHASYEPIDSSITISLDQNFFQKLMLCHIREGSHEDLEKFTNDWILRLICHEETHAVFFQEITSRKELFKKEDKIKLGYSSAVAKQSFGINRNIEYFHFVFNEAITDIVAEEIFLSYKKEIDEEAKFDFKEDNYSTEKNFFRYISDNICSKTGLDKDIFLKVVERGYFFGEDLSGEKIQRLFKNIFPADFEKELANWRNGNDEIKQMNLLNMIDNSKWTDEDSTRVRRWVMSVYHTMPNSQEK